MKRFIFLLCVLCACGCTTEAKVSNIIRDPHFTEYKQDMDQLERDYLQKKITYADYLEQKKQVEEGYEKGVSFRREVVENKNAAPLAQEMAP